MEVGGYRVETLVDARFALDGGSMFGIIPRPLWQRSHPPDERNRIAMVTRLLLIRGGGRMILVDTGLGDAWSTKHRDIFAIDRAGGNLEVQLCRRGVGPEEITDVVLTHLHFDHAGGTTVHREGGPGLRFENARHWLQRRQWQWAHAPSAKDRGSFRAEDFEILRDAPSLELVDGDTEILPGIWLHPVEGHTEAMQLVRVVGPEGDLLFATDLVPTRSHVHLPWIMAYDNHPLRTLAEKRDWLGRAIDGNWILVFQHDVEAVAARLRRADGRIEIAENLSF